MDEESQEIPSELLDWDDWFETLASGESDEELANRTGLTVEVIAAGRKALFARERVKATRSPEEQFAEYRVRIEGILREMDKVAKLGLDPDRPRGPALKTVGDILTAKAKILRETIECGQELGVLPRAAKATNVKVSGGIIHAAMPTGELLDELNRLRKESHRVSADYDMVPFSALPPPDPYGDDVVLAEDRGMALVPTTRVRRKH